MVLVKIVTVTESVVNHWIDYLKMRPDEQYDFLRELISRGRLSNNPKGGYLVYSRENRGKIYNPFLPDDEKILYFVFKNDATDFIEAKKKNTNDIFLYCRHCTGGCNH